MNVLGQAATVAQLAGVDAGSLISMIVQAVQTVQRNKEECRQLMHHVMIIGDLLPLLQQSEMMQRREITVPLDGLVHTLREAYMLVTSCQQSNIMYRFFMAANQAQKFRDVRDRIDSYLRIYPMISHIDTRYFLSRLHGPADPSFGTLQPPASDEVVGSFRSVPNPNFRSERFLRARSPVPGRTMADLPLRVVTDIVKTGMAIKKAVETVRQNEEECQDLLVLVDTPIAILSRLQKMGFMTSRPAMCTTALVVLHGSLVHSLKLVTKCQKSTGMDRFLTAMDMSKQLRRVHNDIRRQMHLWSLAITVSMMEITVELTGTTIVRCDGAHPPLPTQPQGPVEMEIYCSHSTTSDARSKEDGADIIAMMTRGLIEFISLSETVATHHVSEDNISGGSDYTSIVTKVR